MIGVLALQGDFAAHGRMLDRLGIDWMLVKTPSQLARVDGLIIPGGESTTLLKLMKQDGFIEALPAFHAEGGVLFGTCAGLIVLAKDVLNPAQFSFGLIDLAVERNAYGRQRESFESEGTAFLNGKATPLPMVFIRAPRILELRPGVTLLARYDQEPVMAQQGRVLVASFHPELTDDPRVHQYFVEMVATERQAISIDSPVNNPVT
ncbi:MAG: pyridoxal 5'-phosphate synthase glutaminase subunit PdxT [Candidatus Latescibacteria bacterium]|nr:pyridoxal 5'-phosphate synthase glutaminase subunit PdxT [Candidatus Latescibacterota bacterium]